MDLFTLLALVLGAFITFVLTFTTYLLYHYNYVALYNKEKDPPEAGGGWPIIGHLHLLANSCQPPHIILGDMADKYGPIFRIRMGKHKVLVVSDSRIAKEIFTVSDRALAGRPQVISGEILGYNYAMFGLSPYGPYWRDIRKVVVVDLLSNQRLNDVRHFWNSGTNSLIHDIYNAWRDQKNSHNQLGKGKETSVHLKMEMKECIRRTILDIMSQMLFGQRLQREDEEGSNTNIATVGVTFRRFFYLLAAPLVGDYIPWLRWLDIGGYEKAMKEVAKEMDNIVQGWLQQHKAKRQQHDIYNKDKQFQQQDFMDAVISRVESGDEDFMDSGFDLDTIIKSTCLAILGAATDTTTVTIVWALSLLLNNPSILQKMQAELDIHVGKERNIDPSDINNLTYLQAIIKETLRLYPAAPLLLPHEALEDCELNGYHISKGTRLLVNLPKLHRDPSVWSDDSTVFRPERFLNEHKDIDLKGNHFELIPFGSGRRMCQGMSLALQVVGLALARLIHAFDLERISNEEIDMTESGGATNMKATPLYVILTPRLPKHLYT